MLQTAKLLFGWHAKGCSVACKYLKIISIEMPLAAWHPCFLLPMLRAACHTPQIYFSSNPGNTKGYHGTIDLLFDCLGLVCFVNENKKCQLSYSWFQTSQTGCQRYSDTSPFSIPWSNHSNFYRHNIPLLSLYCIIQFLWKQPLALYHIF